MYSSKVLEVLLAARVVGAIQLDSEIVLDGSSFLQAGSREIMDFQSLCSFANHDMATTIKVENDQGEVIQQGPFSNCQSGNHIVYFGDGGKHVLALNPTFRGQENQSRFLVDNKPAAKVSVIEAPALPPRKRPLSDPPSPPLPPQKRARTDVPTFPVRSDERIQADSVTLDWTKFGSTHTNPCNFDKTKFVISATPSYFFSQDKMKEFWNRCYNFETSKGNVSATATANKAAVGVLDALIHSVPKGKVSIFPSPWRRWKHGEWYNPKKDADAIANMRELDRLWALKRGIKL